MKIIYDHQFFNAQKYSGISRYLYEIMRRICEIAGTEISLFMGLHSNEFPFYSYAKKFRRLCSVKFPPLPKTRTLSYKINQFLFPVFASLDKFDIYHQTYYSYLLPSFKGKRIMTVYDMIYLLFPEFVGPGDPIPEELKKSCQHADGIIAISESSKRDLINICSVPEEKIRVIYLANSLLNSPQTASPVEMPYILYVGQRFGWKNFKALLSAYCNCESIRNDFALICFGGTEFTRDELAIMEKSKIAHRIRRVAGPDSLLATYYTHASLLVYPSRYEGFGLPVLEAMHHGCPVLISKTSSLPEVAGSAAMYFDPETHDELCEKMPICLYDSEQRNAMKQKGYEQEKKFSWDRCAKETLDYYKQIAAN